MRHRALVRLCRVVTVGSACVMALTAVEPARAQTSAKDLFSAIRRAVVSADSSLVGPARCDTVGKTVYGMILDCVEPSDFGVQYDDSDAFAVQMAMHVEQSQRSLRALGVPDSVWRPSLDRWANLAEDYLAKVAKHPARRQALADEYDLTATRVGEDLERDVQRYRTQEQPGATEVRLMDGCGAGETPVSIQTQPAGGRVRYIPLFRFRLCEARGLSPQDARACRGWVDVSKPEEFLSGRYAYVVQWPDGTRTTGVFDTSAGGMEDDSEDGVVHIVLSR